MPALSQGYLSPQPPRPVEVPPPPPPAPPTPLAWTVLLAEDNPVNQTVALRILKNLGCRVDTAVNGEEAVRLSAARRYDLILMDCQMPVMSGLEAAKAIRQREAGTGRVPIVAVTANVFQTDRDNCLAAGMDDFLPKPFTKTDLLDVMDRWLSSPNAP